jgi:hypothetical protein
VNTPQELAAIASIAAALGLEEHAAQCRNVARRAGGASAAVAVVGLVSRGKSTLVNRLVGAPVSAPAAIPETAATIAIRTGAPGASGRSTTGGEVPLPGDPAEFCAVARRDHALQIVEASITGPFRLPPQLALIDTPGVADVASNDEGRFATLGAQWKSAGADSALLIVSVPPGLSASDRRLFDAAVDFFGGRLRVVVKATSDDVEEQDLNDVADHVARELGVPALTIADRPPSAGWGEDAGYAQLEESITELAGGVSAALSASHARIAGLLADLAAEIRIAAPGELQNLEDIFRSDVGEAAPPVLRTAFESRSEEIRVRALERADAEGAAERAALASAAERSAERLVPAAEALVRAGDPGAEAAYAELRVLANQGSASARRAVAQLLEDRKRRGTSRLALSEILEVLSDEDQGQVGRIDAPVGDLLGLLEKEHPSPSVRALVEAHVVKALERSFDRQIAAQARSAFRGPNSGEAIERIERDHLMAQLEAAAGADGGVIARWLQVDEAARAIANWAQAVDRHSSAAIRAAAVTDSEQRVRKEAASFVTAARREIINLYEDSVQPGWDGRCEQVHALAQWILFRSPTALDAEKLRLELEASKAGWEEWEANALVAEALARKRAEDTQRAWERAFVGSFVAWAISFVLLQQAPQLAFWVWLGSFVSWLVARHKREVTPEWRSYYVRPPSPLAAPMPSAQLPGQPNQ